MSGPTFSPDGKWMWSGTDWIPAPPAEQNKGNSQNFQDSAIGGDVIQNTVVNNDASAVTSAVIAALKEMGMINKEPNSPQTPPIIQEIELPASFSIGDHVEYHSPTNSRWLNRCTVVNANDDGTYRIEVPKDGGVIETKFAVVIGSSPGTIRPASPPFDIDDKVLVNWKNYGTYYPGKIVTVNEDHTFLIHFDDGDVEYNVEWSRIEKMSEDSLETKEYLENISEAEHELIEAFKIFDKNNSGTISAKEYFEILTEMGDNPITVEEVLSDFKELGIEWDSEIDYRELSKYMVSVDQDTNEIQRKPEVVIRDAKIKDGYLHGYAYAHPKLGEGPVRTSTILGITYDERATARVETRNTVYVVGPTGWEIIPEGHPFEQLYSVGEQIQVEWNGSWYDAIIREINETSYLIHYIGFDTSWDEHVPTSRMKKFSN
ncbi:MAG: hypothetical protein QGI21_05860 [Candidatus Poseidoniaceae archaeon]|jgi:hypothetical protein|nr:hypothetical protein [Candidatus Poseidoniaceae archaeon]